MANCAANAAFASSERTEKKSGAYRNTLASLASLPRKRNTEAKLSFANACEVRKLLSEKHEGDLAVWENHFN